MRYRIDYATVEVYEDSYEHGEGEYIQTIDLYHLEGTYDTMEEVLEAITNTGFGFSSRPFDYIYIDGRIDTDSTVDVYNNEATEGELEEWKRGELKLYNAHLMCAISVVSDEHELTENEADTLGFEIC